MGSYLIGSALFIALAVGALAMVGRVLRFYARKVGDPRQIALDLVSSSLLGMGIAFVLAAPTFWWWIHGSRERYLWIISGPPPYDRLGSGPLQLAIGALLAAAGVVLFALGAILRAKTVERP